MDQLFFIYILNWKLKLKKVFAGVFVLPVEKWIQPSHLSEIIYFQVMNVYKYILELITK